ncbi:hypothetical protein BHE74_00008445 [Ensete ventricosum]|nr:hypothetical protein GW17_00040412 [Ensete ventricosum]RWW83064.1 hypothetical protein BHE74_00008445 [Ensete ventricosum]
MGFDLNVVSLGESFITVPNSYEASSNEATAANGEEDKPATNGAATCRFGIFRHPAEPDFDGDDHDDEVEEESGVWPEPGIVTQQLFPTAEAVTLQPSVSAASCSPLGWADLSFREGMVAGAVEAAAGKALRHLQQQQQQVKKSRRGPRSRSSQYRGVTFYRRTGRWESHIWLASSFSFLLLFMLCSNLMGCAPFSLNLPQGLWKASLFG